MSPLCLSEVRFATLVEKLVCPETQEWLHSQPTKPGVLVEPFVGGGIISLTAVCENIAEKALMVELDDEIAAVWKS